MGSAIDRHWVVALEGFGGWASTTDIAGASSPAAPSWSRTAWGQDGAICVARPRIPENVSLEELAERYPRLKSHLGPAACNVDSAMRDPAALLFNRSGK